MADSGVRQFTLNDFWDAFYGDKMAVVNASDAQLAEWYPKLSKSRYGEFRLQSRTDIDSIKTMIEQGTGDYTQLPDYQQYYRDWVKDYGNLILGNKYWQSPDGSVWSYNEYSLGTKEGKSLGYDYNLTPVDSASASQLFTNFFGDNGAISASDQLALDKFKYQKEQDELDRQNAANQYQDTANYRNQQLAQDSQNNAWQRQFQQQSLQQNGQLEQQSLALEKQKYLAQLKSQPKSWIEAWMFENQQPQQQQTWQSPIDMAQDYYDKRKGYLYDQMNYVMDARAGKVADPWVGVSATSYADNRLANATMDYKYAEQALAEAKQGVANGTALPQGQSPTAPNTPQWLTSFVPGLQSGQPITQQRARVASGQQWAATPWSQRQMLGGYLEYASPAGIPTLTDYEQMVQNMLPQQGRATNWRPMMQV